MSFLLEYRTSDDSSLKSKHKAYVDLVNLIF